MAAGIAQALQRKYPDEADNILPLKVDIHHETNDNPGGIILKTKLICDRLYYPLADRESITPTDVDMIISLLISDFLEEENREEISCKIKSDLSALNDIGVETRCMIFSHTSGKNIFVIGTHILSDALEPEWKWHHHTLDAISYALSPVLANEIKRRKMLENAHGSRLGALKCCPVLLNAILADPDSWDDHVVHAFKDQDGDACAFKDGVLKGIVHIAQGIRWTGHSLSLREKLPDIMKSALVGRRLHDVIAHPLLPNLRIIEVREQRSTGQISIRAESEPVPLGPVIEQLGLFEYLHK